MRPADGSKTFRLPFHLIHLLNWNKLRPKLLDNEGKIIFTILQFVNSSKIQITIFLHISFGPLSLLLCSSFSFCFWLCFHQCSRALCLCLSRCSSPDLCRFTRDLSCSFMFCSWLLFRLSSRALCLSFQAVLRSKCAFSLYFFPALFQVAFRHISTDFGELFHALFLVTPDSLSAY